MNSFEPIIGSGFDSIASQRQFWAQQNASVEQANLARKAAAEQAMNNYFAQVSAQRQRAMEVNADAARNDQRYQFENTIREQTRDDVMSQRAEEYQWRAGQEKQRRKEASRSSDLKSRELDISEGKDPQAFKRYEFDYNNAMADAGDGVFDSPEQVMKAYPGLKSEDAQMVAALSKRSRPEVASQYTQAEGVAKVLNEYRLLTSQKTAIEKDTGTKPGEKTGGELNEVTAGAGLLTPFNSRLNPATWFMDTGRKSFADTAESRQNQISSIDDRINKLRPIVEAYEKDTNLNKVVRFDPNLGRFGGYKPAIEHPSWFSTGTGTAGAPAGAAPTQTATLAPMAPTVAASPAAIEYLKLHPETAQLFDVRYGPGSAASILGQ